MNVDVVRGGAAPEDLAAVVAVLSALEGRGSAAAEPTGYAAWRRGRLAALACSAAVDPV